MKANGTVSTHSLYTLSKHSTSQVYAKPQCTPPLPVCMLSPLATHVLVVYLSLHSLRQHSVFTVLLLVYAVYSLIVCLFAVESPDCGCFPSGCKSLSAVGYIQAHTDPHAVLTVVYLQYIRNKLRFEVRTYIPK